MVTSPNPEERSIGRAELIMLVAVALLGAGLRAWKFSALGLGLFDEGVYAISGYWALPHAPGEGLYPWQIYFSPPLYFLLVGVAYRLFGGASDHAAILVNVVLGSATIPLAWWFARRWFGPAAGMSAAVWVTLSDFHIQYSRIAATDIALGFFYLLSLAVIARAFQDGSLRWAVLSGLAVGAAWNAKYNGWLPLEVAFVVLLALAVLRAVETPLLARLFLSWAMMCAVAVLCILPWVIYTRSSPGGFLAIIELISLNLNAHWTQNLWRHIEMQVYLDGWASRISPAVAFLAVIVARHERRGIHPAAACLALGVLLGAGFVWGGTLTACLASILSLPLLLRRDTPAGWMLAASWGVLFTMTPFYRPFPRLLMPFVLTAQVASAAGMAWLCSEGPICKPMQKETSRQKLLWGLSLAAVLFAALAVWVGVRPVPRTWQSSDSVRRAVDSMVTRVPQGSLVFVDVAPEVAFYFRGHGYRTMPVNRLITFQTGFNVWKYPGAEPHFLVVGGLALSLADSRESLNYFGKYLVPVGHYSMEPSDLRLLEDLAPAVVLEYRRHPTHDNDLHLYRIIPETSWGRRYGASFLPFDSSTRRSNSISKRLGP